VGHRSWNTAEPDGAARWTAVGRPALPAVAVDGAVTPLFHLSQLAAALGMSFGDGAAWAAAGWDIATILRAWASHLGELDFELALEPTPSRGRTLRNLTVNAFHPIELLVEAWETGRFDWNPDLDGERERVLAEGAALAAYAERIGGTWHDFLLASGDSPGDKAVATSRGELAFADLVASQRWHAAYHYRQVVEFLRARGVALTEPVDVGAQVGLPDDVF
jgi:hypothetical protein